MQLCILLQCSVEPCHAAASAVTLATTPRTQRYWRRSGNGQISLQRPCGVDKTLVLGLKTMALQRHEGSAQDVSTPTSRNHNHMTTPWPTSEILEGHEKRAADMSTETKLDLACC